MKAKNLAKMKKLQQEARKRIIERGKVEFRVEPELMSELLDSAQQHKVPLGKMVREWVKIQLEQKTRKSPTQLDKIEHKIDKLLSIRHSA